MAGKRKDFRDIEKSRVTPKGPVALDGLPLKFKYGKYTFDFTPYVKGKHSGIAMEYVRFFDWKIQGRISPDSCQTWFRGMIDLFNFLDVLVLEGERIDRIEDLHPSNYERFYKWLQKRESAKKDGRLLSYSATRNLYYSVVSFARWVLNRKGIPIESIPSRVVAPRSAAGIKTMPDESLLIDDDLMKRLVNALAQEIHDIRSGKSRLSMRGKLCAYFFLIALRTGLNQQPLLDLSRSAIKPNLLRSDREILMTSKIRSGRKNELSFERESEHTSVSLTIGTLYREVLKLTEHLLPLTGSKVLGLDHLPLREYAFLFQDSEGEVIRLSASHTARGIAKIAQLHDLRDEDGELIRIGTRRLRATLAENVLKQSGGDLLAASLALGNTPKVVMSNYLAVTEDMLRGFVFAGNAIVEQFTKSKADITRASKRLDVNASRARKVIDGTYKTGVSRCSDPFHGKFAPKKDDEPCLNWTYCFRCPNQVIFEEDLHRLFSFYWLLIKEKEFLKDSQWAEVYGWVIREIDTKIAPRFKKSVVTKAKAKAFSEPHPLWKTRSSLVKGFYDIGQ